MRKYYRFYYLDEAGQIGGAQPLELADDVSAIARGYELLEEFSHTPALEIWHAARFVARLARATDGTIIETTVERRASADDSASR